MTTSSILEPHPLAFGTALSAAAVTWTAGSALILEAGLPAAADLTLALLLGMASAAVFLTIQNVGTKLLAKLNTKERVQGAWRRFREPDYQPRHRLTFSKDDAGVSTTLTILAALAVIAPVAVILAFANQDKDTVTGCTEQVRDAGYQLDTWDSYTACDTLTPEQKQAVQQAIAREYQIG